MTDFHDRDFESAMAQQALSRIDAPLDRRRVGDIAVDKFAGLTFKEYRDAIEFCKLVAQAKYGLPPFLRGNGPDCVIVTTLALRWRLEPVWVMQNSYITKADGIINYQNFVFAAILNASGLLKGRPRYTYAGEGDNRTCTITATFKGEDEPHDYTTPPLKQCRKNSPLWKDDPDQQLGYFAVRSFARRHIPELLGGVYARDDFEPDETTQDAIENEPVSPNLLARLPGKMEGAGFAENVVDTGLAKEAELVGERAKSEGKARSKAGKAVEKESAPAVEEPREAPEITPEPSLPPQTPQTAEQYLGHVERWTSSVTDPEDIAARWEGERELRDSIKVPIAVRRRAEAMVNARIEGLTNQRS